MIDSKIKMIAKKAGMERQGILSFFVKSDEGIASLIGVKDDKNILSVDEISYILKIANMHGCDRDGDILYFRKY